MDVPFLDLSRHHEPIRDQVLAAWADIFDTSAFVSGSHVASFEASFAAAHDVGRYRCPRTGPASDRHRSG